jgi:hypothetical protein
MPSGNCCRLGSRDSSPLSTLLPPRPRVAVPLGEPRSDSARRLRGRPASDKANRDQNFASDGVRESDIVEGTYPVRADMLGHSAVISRRDQPLCRKARLEREGDMRLGKAEARGFIEEPIEASKEHDDSAELSDPAATDPRSETERLASAQPSARNAPEDQPTYAR